MLNILSSLNQFPLISISPENLTGEKGKGGATPVEQGTAGYCARELGTGWKTNPYMIIEPGETLTLAEVQGQGEIRHIWLTPTGCRRGQIFRIYWDGEETPAVECPLGDFFVAGLEEFAPVNSIPVCVNPGSAFNCYWTMPFRKGFKITIENRNDERTTIYYQVSYIQKPVTEDAAYFHAQFRRENPTRYMKDFSILENIQGQGHYVGTYMIWGSNSNGWWGEGEVKVFIDDDKKYPSICYTGTEDYFCGSYNFENRATRKYQEFTTPYSGLCQIVCPDGLYRSQMRFGMYRWHLTDPICFKKNIRVTVQTLGWRSGQRYLPLQDDLSCVAFFYLNMPSCMLPPLGTYDDWELL